MQEWCRRAFFLSLLCYWHPEIWLIAGGVGKMLAQACVHPDNCLCRALFFRILLIAADCRARKEACWCADHEHWRQFFALTSPTLTSVASFNPHSFPSAV
jgi:hypothetical protein